MHLATLARYPFLPEAAARIAHDGPSLEELLADRVYAAARERGRERVVAAVEHGELPHVPLGPESPERDLLEDLLSYVYARILVSATKDAYVVRRHALAEAVRVRDFLASDTDADVACACAALVELKFEPDGPEGFTGHFTDYLKYAVHLKDMEWKLVRQPLANGRVRMTREQVARLVQEGLRRRVEQELPKQLPPEVEKRVKADLAPIMEAARIRQEQFQTAGFGRVELDLMPPCMKHILGQLQRGENVAHSGRFALTSFLNNIGMGTEDIMGLFSTAPDFREDLTRYQVEHITGGTGTTYTPPGCQAMQTFGICYNADDVCRSRKKDGDPRVKHPLSYYRYMKEANDALEPLVQRVPVANADAMRMRAAMFYPFLRRLQDVGSEPHLEHVRAEDAFAIVDDLKLPIPTKTEGEGESTKRLLVFSAEDDRAIPELMDSNAIRLRAARRKAAAAASAAAPNPSGVDGNTKGTKEDEGHEADRKAPTAPADESRR